MHNENDVHAQGCTSESTRVLSLPFLSGIFSVRRIHLRKSHSLDTFRISKRTLCSYNTTSFYKRSRAFVVHLLQEDKKRIIDVFLSTACSISPATTGTVFLCSSSHRRPLEFDLLSPPPLAPRRLIKC